MSTSVLAIDGVPTAEELSVTAIQPTRVPAGELWFQAPQVSHFYLITAKGHRDAAEPLRVAATTEVETTPNGTLRPSDVQGAFDCLGGLSAAVVLAYAAIEAYANDAIGRLEPDAQVTVKRRGGVRVVFERDSMVRSLRLDEKLDLAVPQAVKRKSIKGTAAWVAFRHLRHLRDELIHVKDRGYSTDPDAPSVFGRLMAGDGSRAPEEAALVIDRADPTWLPASLRDTFDLTGGTRAMTTDPYARKNR